MRKHITLILVFISLLAGCGGGKSEIGDLRVRIKILEREKSIWQTVALVEGVGLVVLFVFGTAIGSSARKDAAKKNEEMNE